MSTTKLWEKEKVKAPQWLEEFTAGNDQMLDMNLAEFDVLGSLAHIEMLETVSLITKNEFNSLKKELEVILSEIRSGKFRIENGVEDIHSQIEIILTQKLGDTGKKIHTARSRNDQVLTDIKLYTKHELKQISALTQNLFDLLIRKANEHKEHLMPGYTHFQAAMPSSFGLWFSAYAESLTDDLESLIAAFNVANKNPLGSGAGYGSSLPINREITTKLLGFESLNYNSVYAQMTRGKTEKAALVGIAAIASTLSKLASDVCLYNSQNFSFISFPEHLTTGSSIMPHKKNPDVFELIRAKCAVLQAKPNEITLLLNNLPSGYHRDFQLTKEILFPAIKEIKSCLNAAIQMLGEIEVNTSILENEKYKFIFSVEAVNELVLGGMSFRDAYKKIGEEINNGTFHFSGEVDHTHQGSIGNLCLEEISKNFKKNMERIK